MPLGEFRDKYPALIERLWQTRCGDRIAHAYLITGDHPTALEQFALGWSQMCLCTAPVNNDACGSCETCTRLANGTYAYQQVLKPRSKSRQILIEQIRELEHYLHLKSDGQIKIGLIHDADRMNEASQNAFLKTLEEPSPHTLLLLLTGNTMSLLPTIRSRCQTLSILQNRVGYDFTGRDELIRVISTMTKGEGAIVAVDAALHIVATLQSLKKEAETEVKQQHRSLTSQSADLDRSVQKRLDDEFLAQAATLYLSRRESLFSVVHTWFAQEYLRSHGVDVDHLPHPELYVCLGDDGAPPLNPGAARRSLDVTEGLLESLRFNVDEPLAIEDFCLQVCAKV